MAAVSTIATVAAVAGVAGNFIGYQRQANAENVAANYNALVNEQNARLVEEKARDDEKRFRIMVRKQEGSNRAALGASGVQNAGSPLELLRSNARQAESDAIQIQLGGMIQRDQYLSEASFSRSAGRSASRAGNMGSAAQLLSGGSDVLSKYNDL